jgi:hypothetical protein
MNGRTALGACFVVLAILAGALFLDRSQRLVPVYAAARDLSAGTPLEPGDLMVVRVRLPEVALRHYLRPSADRRVAGSVLTAPVRRETLVPAGLVLASSRDADLVELPVQVDPGDMARGLRPGDRVQVLAAYTDGARRGRAVVLLPAAEVVQVLQDPTGLAGSGQERGVQLRMPSDRAPLVAAAIATARIFVVKAPGAAAQPTAPGSPPPDDPQPPPPSTSDPYTPNTGDGQPATTTPAEPTNTQFEGTSGSVGAAGLEGASGSESGTGSVSATGSAGAAGFVGATGSVGAAGSAGAGSS